MKDINTPQTYWNMEYHTAKGWCNVSRAFAHLKVFALLEAMEVIELPTIHVYTIGTTCIPFQQCQLRPSASFWSLTWTYWPHYQCLKKPIHKFVKSGCKFQHAHQNIMLTNLKNMFYHCKKSNYNYTHNICALAPWRIRSAFVSVSDQKQIPLGFVFPLNNVRMYNYFLFSFK